MNRITRWNGKKWLLPQGQWRAITDRLAAYENTHLEPEEIEEMKAKIDGESYTDERRKWLDTYTATIIQHGEGGNIPWEDPITGNAYVTVAEIEANADNALVMTNRVGVNHLVIAVYPDRWHIMQVCGYDPGKGLFAKLC